MKRLRASPQRPLVIRTEAGAFVMALGHRAGHSTRRARRIVTTQCCCFGAEWFAFRDTPAWFRSCGPASLTETSRGGLSMRELVARAQLAAYGASRRLPSSSARRGQGTVEYVGLILLVALLMVGMVAAMKGFQGKQGLELAQTIVDKIREAVGQVKFK
jgi:hypothetical protein